MFKSFYVLLIVIVLTCGCNKKKEYEPSQFSRYDKLRGQYYEADSTSSDEQKELYILERRLVAPSR